MNKRPPSPRANGAVFSPLRVTVALVLALRVVGAFVEVPRFWSMDVLRYVDAALALALCIAAAIFFLPSIERTLLRIHSAVTGERSTPLFWSLIVFIGVLCCLFPMRTFYYGDGNSIIPEIYKLGQRETYASEILTNERSAPLSGALILFIARMAPRVLYSLGLPLPNSSLFPFLVFSLLSLGLLACGVFFILRREERVPVLLMLLGTAGTVMFFGYVEFYTLVFVLIALFLLSGLRSLEDGRKWPPVLMYLLACAAHYYTFALLPALAYVLAYNTRALPRFLQSAKGVAWTCTAGLLAGIAVYVASGLWKQDGRIVISAVSILKPAGVQAYTLLSAAHLLDLVNLPLLFTPVSAVFLLVVALRRKRIADSDTPAIRFLFLALFSFAVFLAFANAAFGWARDWDLATPLGGILALLAYTVAGRMKPLSPALPLGLALASVLFTAPWIVMNISQGASTRRFESIIELDAENMYADYALSGFEALRKHYQHNGEAANELRIEKRMVEMLGYPEQYRLLINSVDILADAKSPRAVPEYLWLSLQLLRQADGLRDRGLRRDYAISFTQIDSLAAAVAYEAYLRQSHGGLLESIALFDARHGLRTATEVLKGMEAFTANRYADAARSLAVAADSGFETGKLAALHCSSLLMLGRGADAEALYRKAVVKYPADGELRFLMGYGYLAVGDARGWPLLKEAEGMNPSPAMRRQIQEILKQRK